MPSANDQLRDQQIQHAVALLGYSNAVQKQMGAFLNDLEQDSVEKLAARLASEKTRSDKPSQGIEETIQEIRSLTNGVYDKAHDYLRKEFIEFAGDEAAFETKSINRAVRAPLANKLPAPALLKSIVTERPIHGELLQPFVKRLGTGTADRVEQQIRLGMAAGEGTDKIIARVRGVEGFDRSKNAARALVRTSINSISNQARLETWKLNGDLIKGWMFTATLDSRTTIICSSLDGQVFDLDDTSALPPRHPNCRSTTTAVTKSHEELGLVGKKYSADTRASMDGQIAAPTTYEAFLKRKGEAFQNEHMGVTRADLWRRGKLNLNDFVRNYSEVIPLDELRKLHPEAFDAETVAEAVAPATPAPVAPARFAPIDTRITAETIRVRPRKDITKTLGARLSENSRDDRYDPKPEFRGVKEADLGKAGLSSALTDEAASMIDALMSEADMVADAFGIPRLRGIKTGSGAWVARMGDGVLQVNATYFNGYAAEIGAGSAGTSAATLIAKRDTIAIQLREITADLTERKAAIMKLAPGAEKDAAVIEYIAKIGDLEKVRRDWQKIDKDILKARRTDAASKTTEASTWQPGDDVKARPYTSAGYFSAPLDRARSTMFHEMMHHIHQMTGKTARRGKATPPVEIELKKIFFNKFHGAGPNGAKGLILKRRVPTTYGTQDPSEWAAEQFAFFCMGRDDLVEDEARELFERLLREAKQ